MSTTMEADKAFVLAHAENVWLGQMTFIATKKIFSGPVNKPRECITLGVGESEPEAWANAAAVLKARLESPELAYLTMEDSHEAK